MNAIVTFFSKWWNKPFDPNGNVLNWALFVFLILLLCGIWASALAPIANKAVRAATESV